MLRIALDYRFYIIICFRSDVTVPDATVANCWTGESSESVTIIDGVFRSIYKSNF